MDTKELLALVACVRESLDGLLYRGKSANATDEDMARDDAYYAVDPALSDLELALPALCAEVEALRKDAERYRWLRDRSTPELCVHVPNYFQIDGAELDAAIDAAKEPK